MLSPLRGAVGPSPNFESLPGGLRRQVPEAASGMTMETPEEGAAVASPVLWTCGPTWEGGGKGGGSAALREKADLRRTAGGRVLGTTGGSSRLFVLKDQVVKAGGL